MQRKKYCYLEPDFPKNAFIVMLFFKGEHTTIFPLHEVVSTQDAVSKYVQEVAEHMKRKNSEVQFPERCILIPIQFESLYPLKRAY